MHIWIIVSTHGPVCRKKEKLHVVAIRRFGDSSATITAHQLIN